MPINTIELNRQFFDWQSGDLPLEEALRFVSPKDFLSWDQLVERRRVVVLAEAGAGKTAETRNQAEARSAAGQFAFYATVEDVGRNGLDSALGPDDRAKLIQWRDSPESAGYFFIDSVDEAKLSGLRLDTAIRQIAAGIVGAERRAHIILSGRPTDWEALHDSNRFAKGLPLPPDPELLPPPSPDELLVTTLRNERVKKETKAPETPLIALMVPLDPERVTAYAHAVGIQDADKFIHEIDAQNLWRFVRRPRDLEWVANFWIKERRLGSLTEMIEASLTARLTEPDPKRARTDTLDEARAYRHLRRVGAGLVLVLKQTISIPDSEISIATKEKPLDLAEILPEWPAQDRTTLLNRPAFDPGTFGRARLHNDNEGVVRGYLAARWLQSLLAQNLTLAQLFDLLFSTTYGIELVKPSLQETAAWLAGWHEEIAKEVARRDPSLLMTAGDPANLGRVARAGALERVVETLASDKDRLRPLDQDTLRRFVRGDLAPTIKILWKKRRENEEARFFLLRLITVGALKECADLAADAVYGKYDERTKKLAGRALLASGDEGALQRYAKHIVDAKGKLPTLVVWDAVEALFPAKLGIRDLLTLLREVDLTDNHDGLGFDWLGPALVKRIDLASDCESLIKGLVAQLGPAPADIGHIPNKTEECYFIAITATIDRLLSILGDQDVPPIAIDAMLDLSMRQRFSHSIREQPDIGAQMRSTTARRRATFWRAVETLNGRPQFGGHDFSTLYHFNMVGWWPHLQQEDLTWLLADGTSRSNIRERRVATSAAMSLWQKRDDILVRIRAAFAADPQALAEIDNWLSPPPLSPEMVAHENRMAELAKKAKAEQKAAEKSWSEFIDKLRKDPTQLRNFVTPTFDKVDTRLYHLWRLLERTGDLGSRFSLESVSSIEPIVGREIIEEFRRALIRQWRLAAPRLKSARDERELNIVHTLDWMGITGISLESRTGADWAQHLTQEEAIFAAGYSTLEINGLPLWLDAIAEAWPKEVKQVLFQEIRAELGRNSDPGRFWILENVAQGSVTLRRLMAQPLFDMLRDSNELASLAVAPILRAAIDGAAETRAQFLSFVIRRFQSEQSPELAAHFLTAAFRCDPNVATRILVEKLDAVTHEMRKSLVEHLLPAIFGSMFDPASLPPMPFDAIEKLVEIAFNVVRIEDDINRPALKVYSPELRDSAQHARGHALQTLAELPGQATFDALTRFSKLEGFPIPPERMRDMARNRASQDSDGAAWTAADIVAFEKDGEAPPVSGLDLQMLASKRIADIQHSLLNADFAQGRAFQLLPNENLVQNWVADRLRNQQGRSYSVEREPHVAEEKEPDVRLRAKASDASVAIEIKVVESWDLRDLDDALELQLCGRYLRAPTGRQGILLLVHQNPRPIGWSNGKGKYLSFAELVARLERKAAKTAKSGWDAPQPLIAVLDVSKVNAAKSRRSSKIAKKKAKKLAAKRPANGKERLRARSRH